MVTGLAWGIAGLGYAEQAFSPTGSGLKKTFMPSSSSLAGRFYPPYLCPENNTLLRIRRFFPIR